MQLLISNPPRSTRTKRRRGSARRKARRIVRRVKKKLARRFRRRVRTTPRSQPVARKRRRSRRPFRSFATFAKRSVRRGRRRGGRRAGGLSRALGGFIPSGALNAAAGGLAGFIGCQFAVDQAAKYFKITQIQSGWGRVAAKAAAGLLVSYLMRRFGAPRPFANAFAVGGLIAAGADTYAKIRGKQEIAGLGVIEIDGTNSYPDYTGVQLGMGTDDGMSGEGEGVNGYAADGQVPIDQ